MNEMHCLTHDGTTTSRATRGKVAWCIVHHCDFISLDAGAILSSRTQAKLLVVSPVRSHLHYCFMTKMGAAKRRAKRAKENEYKEYLWNPTSQRPLLTAILGITDGRTVSARSFARPCSARWLQAILPSASPRADTATSPANVSIE
jgi:hypothetical protein